MIKLLSLFAAGIALAAVALFAFLFLGLETGCAVSMVGAVGMSFLVKDAVLKQTKALPNGAATITSSGIDLGNSTRGDFLADCEFLLSAPALTTTELGDTQTITYSLEHDTDSAFGTAAVLIASAIVQTGAGGAGAAAATYRFRAPLTVKRYLRFKAVKTGASNASTSSGTLEAQL